MFSLMDAQKPLMNDARPTNSSLRSKLRPTMLGCVIVAFGLLLWARFILVTGHPRTAIATPPAQQIVIEPHKPMATEVPAVPPRDQARTAVEIGD